MGQYYRIAFKHKGERTWKTTKTSWDFNNGAKLMEHSYIGNPFVENVKDIIFDVPTRLVWAGDYADEEKNGKNLYDIVSEIEDDIAKRAKLYVSNVEHVPNVKKRFLVNDSKKLFVDYSKPKTDRWGLRIDPLPLLTAEGNGRGGGDYCGMSMGIIGSWARDLIYVAENVPDGYKELEPNFFETREETKIGYVVLN